MIHFSKKSKNNKKYEKRNISVRGFTLIEILVVIGIMALISGISFASFKLLVSKQKVEKDTEEAYSMINRARNLTITGSAGSEYGVYFSTTTIIMFSGQTYSPGNAGNEVYVFRNNSTMSIINLSNGSNAFYFKRISGRPSATGTLEVRSVVDNSIREVITIYASGLSEIQ